MFLVTFFLLLTSVVKWFCFDKHKTEVFKVFVQNLQGADEETGQECAGLVCYRIP